IFNGNRWTHQIDALVLPFRETFAAVLFIGLGLFFDPLFFGVEPLTIFGSLFGVLLLKTAAAAIALRLTGLQFWHAVGMGLGLAQVGEFAFVLVLLGLKSEVLEEIEYQRVVAVAVGSLILTPPLMKAGLRLIDSSKSTEEPDVDAGLSPTANERATIIGAGPIGGRLTSQLETMGKEVCLIDLSPINLQPYAQAGFHTVVGDASDVQVLRLAGVSDCPLCVLCVPQDSSAVKIVRAIRRINPTTKLIVRCRYQASVTKLQRLGADYIVIEETEATLALLRALSRFDLTD
ncbi:MAG: NAD-binding protein, partial [Rhodopirellula sp. JB053]